MAPGSAPGGAGWRAMPAAPPRALLRGLAGFRVVRGAPGAPAPPPGGGAPGGRRGAGGGGGHSWEAPGEALLGVVEGVEGEEDGTGAGTGVGVGAGTGSGASAGVGVGAHPPAQLQLRVRLPGGELLLLPAVPEIVPAWSPAEGLLLGCPPPGLLDLARADFWNYSGATATDDGAPALAEVVEPYVRRHTLPDGSSYGVMPTRRELEERDPNAARVVRRAGGYQAAAAALGLHPPKRPSGWWDLGTLEAEIADFMQALWTEIRDPDTGELYCYHQVTGQQVDGRPEVFPAPLVMPTGTAVRAAGRWDLHHGVLANGGYRAVGRALGRSRVERDWHLQDMFDSFDATAEAARGAMDELEALTGLPQRHLPAARHLRDLGLTDLERAIQHHGGFPRVASAMGLPPRHRQAGYWRDMRNIQRELEEYLRTRAERRLAMGEEEDEEDGEDGEDGEGGGSAYMPTMEELRRAGRNDLRYALQTHGSRKVATLLGLKMRRRGRPWREEQEGGRDSHPRSEGG